MKLEVEYYCTKKLIFELAIRFSAIHKELSGSLLELRSKPEGELKELIPTKREIEVLKKRIYEEALKTHSDTYPDSVRKLYQELSVKPSENYMFFKDNPIAQSLEPIKIIESYRSQQVWKGICEKAAVDPDDTLKRFQDPLAYRLCLYGIMEIICLQDLGKSWNEFSCRYHALIGINSTFLKSLQIDSQKNPRYVISVNDAGVFYNGKLYCFGTDCESYIKALGFWLNIIKFRCNGSIRGLAFNKLYTTLTGKRYVNPNVIEDSIVSTSGSIRSVGHVLMNSTSNSSTSSSNNNNGNSGNNWGDFLN